MINFSVSSRTRTTLIKYLSLVFVVASFSWLYAPVLNYRLNIGPNLVSEYESVGMPYMTWFKLADVVAAASFIIALWLMRTRLIKRFGAWLVYAGIAIGVLGVIDILLPLTCKVTGGICEAQVNSTAILHLSESIGLSILIFVTGIAVSLKQKKYWWGPASQLLFSLLGLGSHFLYDHASLTLQVLTIMVQIYWLWSVFFSDYFKTSNSVGLGFIRHATAIFLAINGLVSLFGSRVGLWHLSRGLFVGNGTAWLSQHNIIVGFLFLYLARKLYQGEVTAHRIAVVLMVSQILKYSIFAAHPFPLSLSIIGTVLLIISAPFFNRHSSPSRFVQRLVSALTAVAVTVIIIIGLSALFRIREPEIWERSTFSVSRIAMRASLLEIHSNKSDPLRARVFGQTITAVGIAGYAWIISGLFLPSVYTKRHAEAAERERMQDLIDQYGKSSEDSFKLWPEDKKYWFNNSGTTGIAYTQYKGVVIALSGPIGRPNTFKQTIKQFQAYTRSRGWKLVWLLADDHMAQIYEATDHKIMKIGASAVVDLATFTLNTIRSKWWRWVRNKSSKNGLYYDELDTPLSQSEQQQLSAISEAWLNENNHTERSFALGYFDLKFLEQCRIHVLRDSEHRIVAFTNQLPRYNRNKQTTIDMMRSLPEHSGSVAYLLSEVLSNLHSEKTFDRFDLGFVPFAQDETKTAKKITLSLTKNLFNAYFSASGLRQFKNKFEPDWQDNYIAWDGDWLDLPLIAQALGEVLKVEPED